MFILNTASLGCKYTPDTISFTKGIYKFNYSKNIWEKCRNNNMEIDFVKFVYSKKHRFPHILDFETIDELKDFVTTKIPSSIVFDNGKDSLDVKPAYIYLKTNTEIRLFKISMILRNMFETYVFDIRKFVPIEPIYTNNIYEYSRPKEIKDIVEPIIRNMINRICSDVFITQLVKQQIEKF